MAFIAGYTLITVVTNILMFIIHIAPVVFVAVNAAEDCEVICVGMTVSASIPFTAVFTTEYREMFTIMIEISIFPVIGIVALFAIMGESCSSVRATLIASVIVIILMTIKTLRGSSGKLPVYMTFSAVNMTMSSRQRKICFIMIEICRTPRFGIMTGRTITVKLIL